MRFAVLFGGRAGSGYLRALLKTSPQVLFKGERLLADHVDRPNAAELQTSAIREVFAEQDKPRALRAAGFKVKFSTQVSDANALRTVLEESDALVVHLERRNVVRQTVSVIAAQEQKVLTGRVHHLPGDRGIEQFAIDIPLFKQTLRSRKRGRDALEQFARDSGLPVHRVEYADLLERPGETVEELCTQLNVSMDSLDFEDEKLPVKQVPVDLSQVISNFDELVEQYAGTAYEQMFFRERADEPPP